MKRSSILFSILLLTVCPAANCQVKQIPDPIQNFEKAKYLKENLVEALSRAIKYPDDALTKGLQGDVILTYIITKDGKLSDLTISETPGLLLSTSAIVGMNSLEENWSATRENNIPVDRKYRSVFRFRIYVNVPPVDNKKKAITFLEKEKYSNALKPLSKAIEDNTYDYELLRLRSKVKEKMGDTDGAKDDLLASEKLETEVMSVITIPKLIKNTTRTVTYTETRVVAVPVSR